ncbi:MAG: phytanoyl-CoA dioxygenase family protein [Cyanobacteria bacterium P01_H01_bin.74]
MITESPETKPEEIKPSNQPLSGQNNSKATVPNLNFIKPDYLKATDQFNRSGYCVVPGVISCGRALEIREALAQLFQQDASADTPLAGIKRDGPNYKGIIDDVYVHYPEFYDTFCNAQLTEALTAILGQNFILMPDSSAHWEYFNWLHTDTTTQEISGETYPRHPDYKMVTVGLYLQDNDSVYGGGLHVVPGSHLEPDPYIALRQKKKKAEKSKLNRWLKPWSLGKLHAIDQAFKYHPKGIDIPSKAGDVVIFDMRLIHRSSYTHAAQQSPLEKFAFFSRASANNPIAADYEIYLKNNYSYFSASRSVATLQAIADTSAFHFTVL